MAHTVRSGWPTLAPIAAGTAKPIVAETAGVHPGIGVVKLPELAGPHLVLPHAGHDDGVRRGVVAQLLNHILRLQRHTGGGLVVAEWVLLTPAGDGGFPSVPLARASCGGASCGCASCGCGRQFFCQLERQALDRQLRIASYRNLGRAHLAVLGGVNVNVDDLGLSGEMSRVAGNAVVKAGTEVD